MKKILLLCLLVVSITLNAQITLGEVSTAVGNLPINTNYGYSYSQQIFTKQEINAGAAGSISGLKFYVNSAADFNNSSTWVIYLGHTSKTNFISGSDWLPVTELTEVFSGTVTNTNGVIEVLFTAPFAYDNVQNLVVAVHENTPDYDPDDDSFSVYGLPGVQNRSILYESDYNDPDPSSPPGGSLQEYRSVVSIMGLTPSAIPACATVTYPANNATLMPLSPAITWNASFGAISYKISIGTVPGGTDTVNQQTVTTTNFTPTSPLTANTTYYLRVVSVGAGGESQGCTDIKFKTLPPPPSNDECAGTVVLTVNPDLNCGNVTSGTTLSATNSGLDPDPCDGSPDDDVWYKFTATSTTHIISLSNMTSIGSEFSYSLLFQLFNGDCNNLTNLTCSDYEDSATVDGLTVGETYYIRVYTEGGAGEAQSFNICIGTLPPPPSNDECAAAVALTVNPDLNCGNKTSGYTLGATDSSLPVDPCDGEADDDVWFKFTATSTTHMISLSNMTSIGSESSYSLLFQLFNGDCNNLTSLTCSDYEDSATVDGLTVGETYYIRVYTDGGAGEAQSFNICIGTMPPPPVNDDCSGALVASVFPYAYTQSDAAGTTNNNGFIETCSNGMNDGTWFTFTGDGTTHDITVSMAFGSEFDAQIGVYSGTCAGLTCVDTVDNEGYGGTETLSVPTVVGTTYYVNVGHYDDEEDEMERTFTITINKETLGTSEVSKAKNEIKVYPNPFVEVLNISKIDQVRSVIILDTSGRLVKTIESPSSVLHLGDLKQGMYLVVLNMKDGTKQTIKAIKK
ncbi:MAG: T9SS type A sorting domain-containing protein [Chryseobacterium jejuense]|uniref:T9SS type A sorting domain-containing protein n=1 Tax=Chryseobacterium jejuense TaxID=445960 RepID=UPI003D12E23E